MTKLVDKIERVMRKTNPLSLDGDYYYEAGLMVTILRLVPFGSSIRELCEESFQIRAYRPDDDYDVKRWEALVTDITWLLEKLMAEKRMNAMREELMASAMSPERVGAMAARYGAYAACATFA
jgi:hypothetical protein